jgi:hypothetical protein
MGLVEAGVAALIAFVAVLCCPGLLIYLCWTKHIRRNDHRVMLECAARSGGQPAVLMVLEQLGLSGQEEILTCEPQSTNSITAAREEQEEAWRHARRRYL